MRSFGTLSLVAIVFQLIVCIPCGAEASPPPKSAATPIAAEFVGSESCRSCHPTQFAAWRPSQHRRAMQTANEESVLGDFGGTTFKTDFDEARFFRKDDRFFVETKGPDGTPHSYEVTYTFGVDPLQQYLIPLPGGRLQALSIAWDTRPASDGGQRWFHLYPDEKIEPPDVLHWTADGQNWNAMCAECHSTNLRKNYDVSSDQYKTSWSEVHVGCEACHGPGSTHVAQASQKDKASTPARLLDLNGTESWAMNPKTGIAEPRGATSRVEVETCGRCHSRRTPLTDPYAFGRPLLDTHRVTLLDEDLYFADGQIQDEVYVYGSFLQSKMYEAGVTCSDCHDPHSLQLRAEGNALCARCHLPEKFDVPTHHFHPAGSPASRCVECHMPARTYMVIDPRRDHSFRVPRPDLTQKIGSPNPCSNCHSDRSRSWAADAVRKWYPESKHRKPHYGAAIHAGRKGDVGAASKLTAVAKDSSIPAIARGTAVELLGRYLEPNVIRTLALALSDTEPFVRIGALEAIQELESNTRLQLAYPLLKDPILSVRMAAVPVVASVSSQLVDEKHRSQLEGVAREHRQAQMVSADRPGAHVSVGLVNLYMGNRDAARRDYEKAIEVGPYFVPAYVNLADLYRLEENDQQGEQVLRQALQVVPESAEVHYVLGLLLVRQKRTDEGVAMLRRATELDSTDPHYAYVYGIALSSTGRPDLAVKVLEKAYQARPGDMDTLIALTTIHRDLGQFDAAVHYAALLVKQRPNDPQLNALLQDLESRLIRAQPTPRR